MTRIATLIVVFLLEGCIALPVPYGASMEIYVDEENIDFIEIGETNRAQILEDLREPSWKSESGNQWVYALRYGSRGGVGGCLMVAEEIGGSAHCSAPGEKRLYVLDLRFDDTDVVVNKTVGVATESCAGRDNCWFEVGGVGFRLDLQREFEQRRRERGLPSPANAGDCNVFVTNSENGVRPFAGKLNEEKWEVGSVGESVYVVFAAAPGRHSLTVTDGTSLCVTDPESQSIDFFCESGNPVFLQLAGNSLENADTSDAAERVLFGSPAKLRTNWRNCSVR